MSFLPELLFENNLPSFIFSQGSQTTQNSQTIQNSQNSFPLENVYDPFTVYLNNEIYSTFHHWNITRYSLFHELISLIISQKIRFKIGRNIRRNLYIKLNLAINQSMFPQHLRAFSDKDYREICMPEDKIEIIKCILANVPDDFWNINYYIHHEIIFNTLQKIPGIGPWTISSLKIKLTPKIYPNILLTSDKWISDRLNELRPEFQKSIRNANPYLLSNGISLSEVSLFLWRLTTNSVHKLNNGIKLDKKDFL